MSKKISIILGCLLIIALMCACQNSPSKTVVTSKNDGTFDTNILQSATSKNDAEAPELASVEVFQWERRFASSDESVFFYVNIDEQLQETNMPVIEVSPHFFTGSDAKRIATALFGNQAFYEMEPMLDPSYSKEDLREIIERWTSYPNKTEAIENTIQMYTLLMEDAPEENPHIPVQWTFKKESHYIESAENIAGLDTSEENDTIQVTVKDNGIPYLLSVTTRNQTDFKINNVFAYPYDVLGATSVDTPYFQSMLCQTDAPTGKDIDNLKEKAKSILQQISLGEWQVDQCFVEESGTEKREYIVHINAVPVFEDVPAVRRPQFNNLKSKEAFASNYYLSDASFQFSVNGDLIYFSMISPVDVQTIINPNVQTLSFERIQEQVQNILTLTDIYEYDTLYLAQNADEKLICSVKLSNVKYGLARVKVANTDERYYYIPAYSFYGCTELCGKSSGDIYYESDEETLLVLNAVDGSIIQLKNE